MTQFTTPVQPTVGVTMGPTFWNPQVRDNIQHLKENQSALGGFFRNVRLSSHPDVDLAAYTVQLRHADQIVMQDGVGVADWDLLSADITVSGAGGRSTGVEGTDLWYAIYAIRKSSDGTRSLLLHVDPQWRPNTANTTNNSNQNFRDTSSNQRVAQGIQFVTDAGLNGILRDVSVTMNKVGTPTGQLWLTVESDSAGSPSGVELARSQKVDVSLLSTSSQNIVFVFRSASPFSYTAGTQYHLVWNSSVTVNASNYLQIRQQNTSVYAGGQVKTYNGSAWAGATADAVFSTIVQVDFHGPVADVLPSGYDQYARIGWVYNNSASDMVKFTALNNRVIPLESLTLISPLTATVPTALGVITGGAPLLPPRPTSSNWWMYLASITGGTQRNFSINSGENGYNSTFTIRGNGQLLYAGTTVSGAEVGPILNDSGYLMAKISGDSGGIFVGSWEWQ